MLLQLKVLEHISVFEKAGLVSWFPDQDTPILFVYTMGMKEHNHFKLNVFYVAFSVQLLITPQCKVTHKILSCLITVVSSVTCNSVSYEEDMNSKLFRKYVSHYCKLSSFIQ